MPRYDLLKAIAQEAGSLFLEGYHAPKEVRYKSDIDLVTQYDVAVEELLKARLAEAFPDHTLVGEESSATITYPEKAIYIDPIDGTTNFVHGIPFCAISIGIWEDQQPVAGCVYNPVLEELFYAEKGKGATLNGEPIRVDAEADSLPRALIATGFPYTKIEQGGDYEWVLRTMRSMLPFTRDIRRLGSAALDLCYTAKGTFAGFYEINLKPWDVAAGILIVLEAGGAVSREDGEPYTLERRIIVATNGKIHDALVAKLGEASAT
ncbi:inositol monophosphatase [Sulfurimonas sp. HSL-3221]|uniref:inositol monophosphatase family protein n=1 Tax=Thiomicrolovo sulfuroxydans TaxID=2894755 RepID=UPI001E61FF8E|nr:inositol monophosphatase family protein [Sulfurimonas sp. HSL-3221]UFS62561.1 inositol monophosphatase [Sulfurimonas sp. HSL-3221]